MLTYINSSVWQRRTNKIIAAAVIFIGLTMLISTIPQCIYAGLAFIVVALGWLGWIRMKESKQEPPRPPVGMSHTTSPVLFLVASQNIPSRGPRGPTLPDPNDKPPTYDQIVKLDGLPPDYITVLTEKPPRYEDIEVICSGLRLSRASSGIPVELYQPTVAQVHSYGHREGGGTFSNSSSTGSFSPSLEIDLANYNAIADVTGLHFYASAHTPPQPSDESDAKTDDDDDDDDALKLKMDEQNSKFEQTEVLASREPNTGNIEETQPHIRTKEVD